MIFTKKKTAVLFSTILGTILIIYLTEIVSFYKISGNTMAPTLPINSSIITTNLSEPEHNDLVVIESDLIGKAVLRILGKGGDTIVIRNGVLYRNNQETDSVLFLAHSYKLPTSQSATIQNSSYFVADHNQARRINLDTILVDMDDRLAKSMKLNRLIGVGTDKYIKEAYGEDWSKDNFGPLIIPEDHYFLIGDNRDDSFDSRFIGLVKKDDVYGKKIIVI